MTALVLLLLAGEAAGQSVASVAAIDRACQIAARSAARSRPQVFADVSDPEDSNSRQDWRRFGSRAGLEQYARDGDASSQALFWRHANAVFVNDAPGPPLDYRYNRVDLDGDGTPEVILRIEGRCGSGGCEMYVLRQRGKDYQEITRMTLTWAPIVVSEHKTRGWNDLILWQRSYGSSEPSHYVVLAFDGSQYPANPSVEPANPLATPARGIAYLAGERSVVVRRSRTVPKP